MRRHGFTLLELTLVTAIMGLMLAIAAPRFVALRDASAVRAAVGELGSAFSTARHEAITRRAAVAILFHTMPASVEVRTEGRLILERSLGKAYGVALSANRDSAVYDPRGLGYGASNLTIIVRRGSIVDTLTMSRLGRVRW